MNAWAAHVAQTDADADYVRPEDVHVHKLVLGQGYRDEAAQPLGTPAMSEGPATARITREKRQHQ
jgi:hypothetical protein